MQSSSEFSLPNSLNEAQLINEEYKIWKKYTPFYYDLMLNNCLEFPSLTIEWSPTLEASEDQNYKHHKLILGTHTGTAEPNYLLVGKVRVPKDNVLINIDEYTLAHQRRAGVPAIGQGNGYFELEKKIIHEGEVDRARHMPQQPNIVATKSPNGDVNLYDINLSYKSNETSKPEQKLIGHQKEGFGLSWNPNKTGYLASGAEDGKILVWACQGFKEYSVNPQYEWKQEQSYVHVVAHTSWDTRSKMCVLEHPGSRAEIFSIDTHPTQDELYLTAGDDKDIVLWDKRRTDQRMKTFTNHEEAVNRVEWCPHNPVLFSSAGADRKVCIWDKSKIGKEQTADEKIDGPPELLFIHAGHKSKVADCAWNKTGDLLMASIEEGHANSLHVWKMAKYLYEH